MKIMWIFLTVIVIACIVNAPPAVTGFMFILWLCIIVAQFIAHKHRLLEPSLCLKCGYVGTPSLAVRGNFARSRLCPECFRGGA